ncbi:MAG: DUF1707 domain-containing protein, partial [Solirubrobacterales bacterium]|nr:DUF1707 domain-containing protein [Solirubrobacterales bacterium]
MADSSKLRAGDDERTATIERLGEHYRLGRITADELEERTGAAQTAVTRGELAKLEEDLPKVKRPADLARRAERRRRARREHLTT